MKDDEKARWIVTRETVKEVFEAGIHMDFMNADTLSVRGRPVEIDSTTTDWTNAILVCSAPQGALPGSLVGACEDCGTPIAYRAHAPVTMKRVCVRCARKMGAFE